MWTWEKLKLRLLVMDGIGFQGKEKAAPHRSKMKRQEMSRTLHQGSGMFGKGGCTCPFRDKPRGMTEVVLAWREISNAETDCLTWREVQ